MTKAGGCWNGIHRRAVYQTHTSTCKLSDCEYNEILRRCTASAHTRERICGGHRHHMGIDSASGMLYSMPVGTAD